MNGDGEADGVTGQDMQETGWESWQGRRACRYGTRSSNWVFEAWKDPQRVRSNSRVCKKLISIRGSNWGWTGREKG